jgi:uncharacterized protein
VAFNKKAALALSIVIGLFVFYSQRGVHSSISIRNHKFYVEVADTKEKREIGLLNIHSLDEDKGMIFIYTHPQPIYIWMKNTYVSLDILWVNQNKHIVHIEQHTKPLSTHILESLYEAQYILEINAGLCDKYKFSLGDTLSFKDL